MQLIPFTHRGVWCLSSQVDSKKLASFFFSPHEAEGLSCAKTSVFITTVSVDVQQGVGFNMTEDRARRRVRNKRKKLVHVVEMHASNAKQKNKIKSNETNLIFE